MASLLVPSVLSCVSQVRNNISSGCNSQHFLSTETASIYQYKIKVIFLKSISLVFNQFFDVIFFVNNENIERAARWFTSVSGI